MWDMLSLQHALVIQGRCQVWLYLQPARWVEMGFHSSFTPSTPARDWHRLGTRQRLVEKD